MSRRILRLFALSLALMLLAGACGGSDDKKESSQSNQAAEGDQAPEEFCDAYTNAQAAVIGASSGGDTSHIPDLLDQVEASAPDEIRATIDEFIPQVRDALEKQDDSVFESDDFQAADEELDNYVADNCGFDRIDVSAVEYSFEGLPSTIEAGPVVFDWTNDGAEVHEMILVKALDDSLTLDDLLKMSDKDAESKLKFVNGFFGPSGTEDVEPIPLEPGRYFAVCFLPVGATTEKELDKAEGPPHITKGMKAEFTVE